MLRSTPGFAVLATLMVCLLSPGLAHAVDTDGDGLSDEAEAIFGTNPALVDTDGGGESDGDEVANNRSPTSAGDDSFCSDGVIDAGQATIEESLGLGPREDFDATEWSTVIVLGGGTLVLSSPTTGGNPGSFLGYTRTYLGSSTAGAQHPDYAFEPATHTGKLRAVRVLWDYLGEPGAGLTFSDTGVFVVQGATTGSFCVTSSFLIGPWHSRECLISDEDLESQGFDLSPTAVTLEFGLGHFNGVTSTSVQDLRFDNIEFASATGSDVPAEECDDGNLINGDGCSDSCTIQPIDSDGDGDPEDTDCDDDDPNNSSIGVEVCDGQDNNCDSAVDEGFDVDGDGVTSCGPDGLSGNDDDDCDDDEASVSPEAEEICDGLDNDCDGIADADPLGEVDLDSDGFLSCEDCDDDDASVNPGADEICDGLDTDCDGAIDDDETIDSDGDGSPACGDCDDYEAAASPELPEDCTDGIDNDCDEAIDGADDDCGADVDYDGDGYCENGTDLNDDGDCSDEGEWGTGTDVSDCDDNDPSVYPGAQEVCDNGVDEDCDGYDSECGDSPDPDCSCGIVSATGGTGKSAAALALLLLLVFRRRRRGLCRPSREA